MAKIGEMLESKYLRQSDIQDEQTVTIQATKKANVAKEGDEPQYKWLVKFEELSKPLVLNATNIKRMAKSCGDDTDDWPGKQVVIYVDPDVEYAGNIVGGLRIKSFKAPVQTQRVASKPTGGKFDDVESDVPF